MEASQDGWKRRLIHQNEEVLHFHLNGGQLCEPVLSPDILDPNRKDVASCRRGTSAVTSLPMHISRSSLTSARTLCIYTPQKRWRSARPFPCTLSVTMDTKSWPGSVRMQQGWHTVGGSAVRSRNLSPRAAKA